MKFRVVYPLVLVLALGLAVVLGGCIKHQEPNQQAEAPKIVAADSVSYGLPSEEAHVRRCLAIYDSLLAQKDVFHPRNEKYITEGIVYVKAGWALHEAIDVLNGAECRAPSDYFDIASLTLREWTPRYRRYQMFFTSDQMPGSSDQLREMSAEYELVLERGLGSQLYPGLYTSPVN